MSFVSVAPRWPPHAGDRAFLQTIAYPLARRPKCTLFAGRRPSTKETITTPEIGFFLPAVSRWQAPAGTRLPVPETKVCLLLGLALLAPLPAGEVENLWHTLGLACRTR